MISLPLSINSESCESEQHNGVVNIMSPNSQLPFQSRNSRSRNNWRQLPMKTTIVSLLLFIIGFIFLVLGIIFHNQGRLAHSDQGYSLIVIGLVLFIPGCYACFVLLGTLLGWQGFSYTQIPSYDS